MEPATTAAGLKLPTDYIAGYEAARRINPELADKYVEHAWIGDPPADAAVEALAALSGPESAAFVQAGMNGEPDKMAGAPQAVKDFFELCDATPEWVDPRLFGPGYRMFHRNIRTVLAGMLAGVLVEGFCTNIAKSFFITGRLREAGVRRLKQNNRHLLELFIPGGLEQRGDGWKLTVRLRLVHARIRRLLAASDEWDAEAWGTPISSAHIAFATTAFSARLLRHMKKLGGSFSREEAAGLMAIWRYTAWLMGVPDAMLFTDEADAIEFFHLGLAIEPEPDLEGIAMANALLASAPLLLGTVDRTTRRSTAGYIYKVSRALIGAPMADSLRFDRTNRFGVLPYFRFQTWSERALNKLFPNRLVKANPLASFFDVSYYQDEGDLPYRLPDRVYAEDQRQW